MTTIAHLSDFHFGTELAGVAAELVPDVIAQRPDLVAFSGDATQRALEGQYLVAREYLDRFPRPIIAVPGNHDIPLYNPLSRAFGPRKGYRTHIDRNTEPTWFNESVALMCVDTTRHYFWKDGRVSTEQLERIRRGFASAAPGACRIVMMHHPCVVPPEFPIHNRVDNAERCIDVMSSSGVELVLAGHMHDAFVVRTIVRPPQRPTPIILSQAGTAISDRRRSQPNSYNLVRITDATIEVSIRQWQGFGFGESSVHRFDRVARNTRTAIP